MVYDWLICIGNHAISVGWTDAEVAAFFSNGTTACVVQWHVVFPAKWCHSIIADYFLARTLLAARKFPRRAIAVLDCRVADMVRLRFKRSISYTPSSFHSHRIHPLNQCLKSRKPSTSIVVILKATMQASIVKRKVLIAHISRRFLHEVAE